MKKLPSTISEEELIKILKITDSNKHKAAFTLGFYQAMRISEIVDLRPWHWDEKRGFMNIKDAKGGKDRDIPLMKPAKKALKHIPVGIGIRALQKAINKYSLQGIGRKIKFHTLRHSGATWYLNVKKVPIRYIQILLGHSSISTTQIYTHVNPSDLQKEFDALW